MPYPISDSVWLANGSLLVGAGHLMFLYGQLTHENANLKGKTRAGTLFDYAARQNGPLLEYHPQILLQCLLWGASAPFPSCKALIDTFSCIRESGDCENDHSKSRSRFAVGACWRSLGHCVAATSPRAVSAERWRGFFGPCIPSTTNASFLKCTIRGSPSRGSAASSTARRTQTR